MIIEAAFSNIECLATKKHCIPKAKEPTYAAAACKTL